MLDEGAVSQDGEIFSHYRQVRLGPEGRIYIAIVNCHQR